MLVFVYHVMFTFKTITQTIKKLTEKYKDYILTLVLGDYLIINTKMPTKKAQSVLKEVIIMTIIIYVWIQDVYKKKVILPETCRKLTLSEQASAGLSIQNS